MSDGRFVKNDPRFKNDARFVNRHLQPRKPADNPETRSPTSLRVTRTLSARTLDDLDKHYTEEGHLVWRLIFRENPSLYGKIVASTWPKEVSLTASVNVYEGLTIDQVAETIEQVQQLRIANGHARVVIDGDE